VKIATESLLMESARRIDEWSRIADKIPHLRVVPVLAEVADDHESQLDLLPHEWEVLSLIDGERDLRAIADLNARDDFETAKVIYGLITTGVVEIRPFRRVSVAMPMNGAAAPQQPPAVPPAEDPAIIAVLNRGFASARDGDLAAARESWERFLARAPDHPAATRVRAALEAVTALRLAIEAHDHE